MPKSENSSVTFWVIFKNRGEVEPEININHSLVKLDARHFSNFANNVIIS